jgi:hypothetical protein
MLVFFRSWKKAKLRGNVEKRQELTRLCSFFDVLVGFDASPCVSASKIKIKTSYVFKAFFLKHVFKAFVSKNQIRC